MSTGNIDTSSKEVTEKSLNHIKSVRCVLSDPALIEAYEKELFDKNLSERELIERALRRYFEDKSVRR